MAAIFDIWIIGDTFLHDITGTLQTMKVEAKMNKKAPSLYIHEYYNVFTYIQPITSGVHRCVAQVLNALTEALNNRARLPHFIVVILDKDLIDECDPFKADWKCLITVIQWLMKQINLLIHCKCLDIT